MNGFIKFMLWIAAILFVWNIVKTTDTEQLSKDIREVKSAVEELLNGQEPIKRQPI